MTMMVNLQLRSVPNYNLVLYNAKAGIILKNVYFFSKQNKYLNIYSMFIDSGFSTITLYRDNNNIILYVN